MIKVTDNINFYIYNNEDKRHVKALSTMMHDKEISKGFGPLVQDIVPQEDVYLVEIEGNIIGIIDFNEYEGDCYISYAIMESERRKGYLNMLLKAVPSYVFSTYPNVKEVLAYIKADNIGSINGTINAGFKMVSNSNPDYIAYSYSNPNIINKTR